MKDNIEIIFELWNKVLKKFKTNAKINFLVIPKLLNENASSKIKKKHTIDLKKLSNENLKIEMKVLDVIYNNYKKIFIDNESMKTLNNIIVPPFSIKEKTSKEDRWIDYISFYDKKGKFNVKKTRIFATYSPSDKKFMWFEGTKDIMCESFENLNNLSFCKYHKILSVDNKTADSLALWFRATFCAYSFYYPSDKDMKTFNLIKFEVELEKDNKKLIMYTISDYGIKEPDENIKIQIYNQLESLNLMVRLLNKKSKVKKLKMEGHKLKISKKLKNKLNLD